MATKSDFAAESQVGLDTDSYDKGDGVFRINPNPKGFGEKMRAYAKLMVAAMPWIGVQSIWAAEFGTTTPYLQNMGLSPEWASQIWISGPLMGFFVAPIVGSLSDRSTSRFGRRRPYMLGGLILLGIVSITLALSKNFPEHLVLPIGCTMFVLMDGTINVIQTPLRAIVADVSPPSMQSTGQLMAAMFQGLGGLLGYVLQKYLYTDPVEILWLFICVFLINLTFVGLTCYFVKEEVYTGETSGSIAGPFIDLAKSLTRIDGRMLRVMVVEWFSWWALFCWWPTSSTWFTEIVMGGCPDNPANNPASVCTPESFAAYQRGLEMNADANILANVLQLCYSLLLSLAMATFLRRVRFLWAFSLAVGCVLLLLTMWGPKEDWYAMTAAICISIPISAINSFPFAVVGKYQQDDMEESGAEQTSDTATMFGLLNLSIVIPQIIVTFVVGSMRTNVEDGLSWVLVMAGVSMGIAAVAAVFVKEVVKAKILP